LPADPAEVGLLGLCAGAMTERVEEFIAAIKRLSDEERRELAPTPESAYFMHHLYKLLPGDPLTLERAEMDAQIYRQFPCST
jgi:hypothetical protein